MDICYLLSELSKVLVEILALACWAVLMVHVFLAMNQLLYKLLLRYKFTFSLLTSIISSQLAFLKSEINLFWSKFFKFLLNKFDLDSCEFAKKKFKYCKLRKIIRDCWCKTIWYNVWVERYITEVLSIKVGKKFGNSCW